MEALLIFLAIRRWEYDTANKQKQKNFPSSSLIFMFSFAEDAVWYQSQTKHKAIDTETS